jgi:hypothetical protein
MVIAVVTVTVSESTVSKRDRRFEGAMSVLDNVWTPFHRHVKLILNNKAATVHRKGVNKWHFVGFSFPHVTTACDARSHHGPRNNGGLEFSGLEYPCFPIGKHRTTLNFQAKSVRFQDNKLTLEK